MFFVLPNRTSRLPVRRLKCGSSLILKTVNFKTRHLPTWSPIRLRTFIRVPLTLKPFSELYKVLHWGLIPPVQNFIQLGGGE